MGRFQPGSPAQPDAVVTIRIGGTFLLGPFLDDLEELVYELRESGSDGQITYRPPSGYGVTLYQTVMLYIALRAADASIGDVTKQVVDAVINWIKKTFKRDREEGQDYAKEDHHDTRPRWQAAQANKSGQRGRYRSN